MKELKAMKRGERSLEPITLKDWVFYYFICADAGLIEDIDCDSAMDKIIKFFLQDQEMLHAGGEEKLIK